MGQNNNSIRELKAEDSRRIPEFMLKGGLTVRRALKKKYYVVPHGQSDPEVAGKEPVYEGQDVDESKLDLVIVLDGVYLKPSILAMNNQTPAAGIGVLELTRIDWLTFKDRAERTLNGEQGVPNFIED